MWAHAEGNGVPVSNGEGKVRCQGSAEGVAPVALATGPVPEAGAGPGAAMGGSD